MSFLTKLASYAKPSSTSTTEGKDPAKLEPISNAPTSATQNPLDLYGALQQNSGNGSKTAPEFAIPSETIQKAAGQLDFVKSIPQDAMSKLQAGDLSALGEVLNAVGRNAYSMAMEHGIAVTGKHIGDRMAFESEGFDERISTKLTTSNVKSIESLHPNAQSMFKDTLVKLRKEYPGASQEELEGATWEIFQEFSGQFNKDGKQQEQQQKAQEVSYDDMAGYGAEGSTPTQ